MQKLTSMHKTMVAVGVSHDTTSKLINMHEDPLKLMPVDDLWASAPM